MPVHVVKREGKFRVVEAESGQIAKTKAGTAADGGGHASYEAASKQAKAINASGER